MQILSYVLSIAGLGCMIAASLIKGKSMEKILLFVFSANILVATSYLFSHTWNGAASCFVGAVQTIINYFFDSKNKKIPVWLVAVYALAFVVVNLAVFTEITDIIAIVASLTFIMCIGQKNGKKYRVWSFINMCLWCLYDILKGSYAPLITHGVQIISVAAGMILHDAKKSEDA